MPFCAARRAPHHSGLWWAIPLLSQIVRLTARQSSRGVASFSDACTCGATARTEVAV